MVGKAKRALRKVLSYIPQALPDTPAKHVKWADSVIELSGYPNNPSFRRAVATHLMHLDHKVAAVSKNSVISALRRAAANQTAYQIIQQCNQEEKQAEAASELSSKDQGPQEA